MSESRWMIGGVDLADLGITVAGGMFTSMDVSYILLDAALDIDAAKIFEEDDEVELVKVDGEAVVKFFVGKVRKVPKVARPEYEGHTYVIEDAWRDLEMTTYQESWLIGAGSFSFPRFVMGVKQGGDGMHTTASQVAEFVEYAASVGVNVTSQIAFTGERLLPSEERNISCSEGIRMALKYRPDIMSYPDLSGATPKIVFKSAASMSAVTVNLADGNRVKGFDHTDRIGLMPTGVKIVYELATTISDGDGNTETYRDAIIDSAGPETEGPKVLVASVQLEGLQAQIQKSRIQTRTIPTGPSDTGVKAWIKEKFPHMKDVPDAAFNVTKFTRRLLADDLDHPDPINPNAERLSVASVDDLPRELVKGSIEDWMRVKVGDIGIEIEIEKAGDWDTATTAAKTAWKKGVRSISRMTATSARTKIYKSIAQWVLGDQAPEGVASDILAGITNAGRYEGSLTIAGDEADVWSFVGKKLRVTGTANSALATMDAPIHSVSWDIQSGDVTIGFGPNPLLSVHDFIEYQRSLRLRPLKWWSADERSSNKHGFIGGSSANGDSVGIYDLPKTEFEIGDPSAINDANPFGCLEIRNTGAGYGVILNQGFIREILTVSGAGALGVKLHDVYYDGKKLGDDPPPLIPIGTGNYAHVNYKTDKTGTVKADPLPTLIVSPTAEIPSTHYQPVDGDGAGGADGDYYVRVGGLASDGDRVVWVTAHNSDIEHYHDLWTGTNIGDGAAVFKGRKADTDQWEFRGVKAGWAIKSEVSGDDVKVDFVGTNVGGGTPILIGKNDEGEDLTEGPAEFRTIREISTAVAGETGDGESAPSGAQIHVVLAPSADGGTEERCVLIKGNGYCGSNDFAQVQDGLVTALLTPPDPGDTGEGWWGDVTINYNPAEGSSEYITFRFERGRLKQMFTYASGEISGTEATPGLAAITISDTIGES